MKRLSPTFRLAARCFETPASPAPQHDGVLVCKKEPVILRRVQSTRLEGLGLTLQLFARGYESIRMRKWSAGVHSRAYGAGRGMAQRTFVSRRLLRRQLPSLNFHPGRKSVSARAANARFFAMLLALPRNRFPSVEAGTSISGKRPKFHVHRLERTRHRLNHVRRLPGLIIGAQVPSGNVID